MYLPYQLHFYSTFHALIKQPSHITCKITDTILSTLVRLSFRKAPVTSTTSQSSTWKDWGWFMLSQSLLVGLSRIASLTMLNYCNMYHCSLIYELCLHKWGSLLHFNWYVTELLCFSRDLSSLSGCLLTSIG